MKQTIRYQIPFNSIDISRFGGLLVICSLITFYSWGELITNFSSTQINVTSGIIIMLYPIFKSVFNFSTPWISGKKENILLSFALANSGLLMSGSIIFGLFFFGGADLALSMADAPDYWLKYSRQTKPLLLFILSAIIEEVFFRGFLQTKLENYNIGFKARIVVVSMFFSFRHLPLTNGILGSWEYLAGAFVMGCLLGFLKEKTQSVYPGMVLHVSYNIGFVFSFAFIGHVLSV